ncbi:MAG TPA: glycosyltransferase family 1 protein [Candidatus Bathyarchaeia archaeon]|nr:glycosyltransferase family 1 protein [Candidatus Bathyarchaeia archaeon]
MIVAIDANEANIKNRVGSNVYAYQVLKHLYRTHKVEFRNNNRNLEFKVYLKNKPLFDFPKETLGWQYKVLKPGFLWTQWRLPFKLLLSKPRPDVFFTLGHYAPRFCPVPLVISIMDLAFLSHPNYFRKKDLFQLKSWTKKSINKALKIIAISQSTRNDIINLYQVPSEKIIVTYPGIEKNSFKNSRLTMTIKNLKNRYKINKKYFLYIGTLQPRKNIVRLMEAFKNVDDFQLVICGKKGWLYEEIFQKVRELKLESRVIFTGFVSEAEKYALLKNAFAFVFPSLYEGFGFPVLEAMQVGCPVLVSKTSSLPEVAGEACVYIKNPRSVRSIHQAIEKMIKLSEKERKNLVSKGFSQVKKFSWQKTAREVLQVLTEVGG